MVRFSDILLHLLYIFILFLGFITVIAFNVPYLFFIPFLIIVTLKIFFERKKKILPYVKDDFSKIGYELLSERPLKLSETETKMRLYTGVKINNIPIERYGYIKKISRVFTARYKDGTIHELRATVTKQWNGSNSIEIKNSRTIADTGESSL